MKKTNKCMATTRGSLSSQKRIDPVLAMYISK